MDRMILDGRPLCSEHDKEKIDNFKESIGMSKHKLFIGFVCTRGSISPRQKEVEPELTERQKLIKRLKKISKECQL